MLKKLSLKIKLFALVTAVVLISFVVVSVLVSNRSIDKFTQDAFSMAEEMAEKYRNEIMAELQGARVTSETLKTVLETLKEHDITDREMMNDMLQTALAQKEYITAFCIAYEPGMPDGADAQYAGQAPVYGESGRFAPYWNKLGDNITVVPLSGIDDEDWYAIPKATKREYITDPYLFHIQGQDVMLASFIFPLLEDGEFIGIIASDIVLDKLQEMVSQVGTRGMGEYTEVFSNSGTVAAHPNKDYLGKTLAETFIYDLLISHPERLEPAIRDSEAYLAALPADHPDREEVAAFVESLRESLASPGEAQPELELLTPALAQALLENHPDEVEYLGQVSEAIQNGEMITSVNHAYYIVYMPIRFSEDTNPWTVAVSVPMPEVLKASESMRDYVLAVCALSVCVIAFIIYLISDSITKPILTLADTAMLLGEGQLDAEVPVIQNSKEIATLSTAFKGMVEQIDGLIRELRRNAEELEEKNTHLNDLNDLLAATNRVAATIINVGHQQFQEVLNQTTRLLGSAAGAEGVTIWQNFTYPEGQTYARQLSAWAAGQHAPQTDTEAAIDLDKLLPGWEQVASVKDACGGALDGSGVLQLCGGVGNSLFFIPLVLNDTCWGFISFAYKDANHQLPCDASEILRSCGMMVASAIIQHQIAEDLEEAEEKAATDALTGLTNRNGFLFKASVIFSTCKEEQSPLALLFLDLDHFKRVNDQYGHPFGDEVLKAFAAVVRRETHPTDVCCRYGGEEFILLQYGRDTSAGLATANRILEAVRNTRLPEYPTFTFTVSIGMVCATPERNDTLNDFIKKADTALYMAKDNGRNQVMVYTGQPL